MGDDQRASLGMILQRAIIVLAAFVLTLFVYIVCQRFMENTRGRFSPLMRAAEMDDSRPSRAASDRSPTYSPYSPSSPVAAVPPGMPPQITGGAPVAGGYRSLVPPSSPVLTPPSRETINRILGEMEFRSNDEREAARRSVQSLKLAVQNVRKYDSSFWNTAGETAPSAVSSASVRQPGTLPLPGSPSLSTDGDAPSRLYVAQTTGDTAQQQAAERIYKESEALATELTLMSHPDLFPEPLRELAGAAGREARIYLSTVQRSLNQSSEKRNELRGLAQPHLTRSEAAIAELERAVGTGYSMRSSGVAGVSVR
ncbi:MAG: hypothetical protein OHK0029_00890 [Armatimonadaceae bacterium]